MVARHGTSRIRDIFRAWYQEVKVHVLVTPHNDCYFVALRRASCLASLTNSATSQQKAANNFMRGELTYHTAFKLYPFAALLTRTMREGSSERIMRVAACRADKEWLELDRRSPRTMLHLYILRGCSQSAWVKENAFKVMDHNPLPGCLVCT